MSVTIQQLHDRLLELKEKVDTEAVDRFKIQQSKEWLDLEEEKQESMKIMKELQEEIAANTAAQKKLEEAPGDSRPEYEEAKAALLAAMQLENLERFGSAIGKFSESKKVDGARLFRLLEGDIDEFMQLATVTQAALKEFAKDRPQIKKPLLSCIVLDKRELKDIDIELVSA